MLLADTESLTSVLLYHVVEANVASYMLSDSSVDTLEGSAVEIDVSGDAVMLNNVAKVIDADLIAKNGESRVVYFELQHTSKYSQRLVLFLVYRHPPCNRRGFDSTRLWFPFLPQQERQERQEC